LLPTLKAKETCTVWYGFLYKSLLKIILEGPVLQILSRTMLFPIGPNMLWYVVAKFQLRIYHNQISTKSLSFLDVFLNNFKKRRIKFGVRILSIHIASHFEYLKIYKITSCRRIDRCSIFMFSKTFGYLCVGDKCNGQSQTKMTDVKTKYYLGGYYLTNT
jgi:hypothetical protein